MRTQPITAILLIFFAAAGRATAAEQAAPGVTVGHGETVYMQFCSSCHGQYGRGDGPLAADLKRPLPDFTDSRLIAGRSEEQMAKGLMAASHGPMSVADVLKPEALKAAIAYVRSLSVPGKHVSVPAGRDIYNAAGCWGCHGTAGDGRGPVAVALASAPPRDFTSAKFVIEGREDEIGRIIASGAEKAFHGSKHMPEWSSRLSPQQVRDVVEYLKTFQKK